MARKKVREVTSKALLKAHIKRLAGLDLPLNAVQVRRLTASQTQWLGSKSALDTAAPL